MLSPITITLDEGPLVIQCKHARQWPPGWARSGQSADALRLQGRLEGARYERAKTWERVCGLMAMDEEKCPTCPHARGPDGQPVIPDPAPMARVQTHSPKKMVRR